MLLKSKIAVALVALGMSTGGALATTVSPAGGALPSGVSAIGGIVFDGTGLNGTRLVAQAAASSLFAGNAPGTNPSPVIGTQTGFDAAILGSLGGGFSELAIRVTLFDGDHRAGQFDFNDSELTLNNLVFGNFSDVAVTTTNSTGVATGSGTGFGNNLLDTGFFFSDDLTLLASLYTSLTTSNSIVYGVLDQDPGDQFYDFSQGIDSSLINVGTGPIVTPPPNPNVIPLPAAGWMLLAGLGGLAAMRRRKDKAAA